jgi:DNA-binding transcriptional regulator YdaS (Cro superfamily)
VTASLPLGKALATLLAVSQSEFDQMFQADQGVLQNTNPKIAESTRQALKSFEDAFEFGNLSRSQSDEYTTLCSLLGNFVA